MKILIVDDEPLVRRSLGRALTHAGHQVEEAENGQIGLEKWIQSKPEVVLLDVLMPLMSGPQVLKEVPREILNSTKVALMSAYSGGHAVDSAQSMGAQLFLPKPFEDIFAIVKIVENMRNS